MNTRTFVARSLVIGLCLLAACGRQQHRKPVPAAKSVQSNFKVSSLRVADPLYRDRLLTGFLDGTEGWLWTAPEFSVLLDVPPPLDARTDFAIDFAVPQELIDAVHEVTVSFRVNGNQLGKRHYTTAERHTEVFEVPGSALQKNPAVIEVKLDRSARDPTRNRDLGLVAVNLALKHPDNTVLDHDTAIEMARDGYIELLKRRKMTLTTAQQNEMMKLFHEIPVWGNMWFHNVPIAKNPLDLWMMQQIMYEIQPEFVIETGTYMGGSALYWAHTLNGLGLENSKVFTCDIGDYTTTASKHPLWKKYVHFWKTSSTDPTLIAEFSKQVQGHRTLITLDSEHSKEHVLNELRLYAPLVSSGSYLVVEDTHMDGVPTSPTTGPGPMAAVVEFLREGGARDFEQDLSREAFIITFNPGGWLRRK